MKLCTGIDHNDTRNHCPNRFDCQRGAQWLFPQDAKAALMADWWDGKATDCLVALRVEKAA